jgi:outer membrane protein assembly factor BamB
VVGAAGLMLASLGTVRAVAAMPVSGPAGPCPATWLMYQHDASHHASGCSAINQQNATTLHLSWYHSTPGAVTAEPIVADHTVYVGESTGTFFALDEATGATTWTFAVTSPQTCFRDQTSPYTEKHNAGFGSITSSAAFGPTVLDAAHNPLIYLGGGGSLFALDSVTGKCQWAQDVDPGAPTSSVEIESSPVIDTTVTPPLVLVGSDDNSGAGAGVTGLQAFNASTGALLWRYEPERDVTLTAKEFGGSEALTLSCGDGSPNPYCNPTDVPGIGLNELTWADACGDVWSSPSLDPTFEDPAGDNRYQSTGTAASDPAWTPKQITTDGKKARDGLVVFGTGNCGANPNPATTYAHHDYAHTEGEFGLDPVTGVRVWNRFEPPNLYNTGSPNEGGAGDTDFGGSSILATVPTSHLAKDKDCGSHSDTTNLVIQGGKSGYAYGFCEQNGSIVWSVQVAQPAQISPEIIGAGGGFIGSPALGVSKGRSTVFLNSALILPFADDGFREPGDGDDTGAMCPGPAGTRLPLLPACPDPSMANHPSRLLSLDALDAATGQIDWRAPTSPSFAAVTYSNGVVFAPTTTQFSADAYNADTGTPLWVFPLGAATTSGTAVAGSSVFVGSGLAETQAGPNTLPPGNNGIWSFTTAVKAPSVSGLPAP